MTDQTETTEQDLLLEDGVDDSDLVKALRAKLRKEAAAKKESQAEVESFREARKQNRASAIADAVNGKGIPKTAVDALVVQVEDMDEAQYASVLEDLNGVAAAEGQSEEGEGSGAVKPAVNPADLGEQVAAAASGGTDIDPIAALRGAKNKAELQAKAQELLAPHGLGNK